MESKTRMASNSDNALSNSWEWTSDEIKRIGYRVVDLIAEHLTTLPDQPVFRPFPKELAETYLNSSVPASGQSADEILDEFSRQILPFPFGNGHPRFYGWVNSPPAPISIFAEALAAAMNPSCAGGNHAAIYVERQVIGWFRQILGFPADSMGILVSGGSMAALTALAVARHAKSGFNVRETGLRGSPAGLVYYRGGEGHGCNQKALELMGIGSRNLRTIEHDSSMRIMPSSLEASISQDKEQGRVPIAVIASAGTVNSGAVDPLDEIADICAQQDVWLHVDGAYGAPAILTSKYSAELAALSRADSIAIDPHKWFYIPVEAGLVLVRDGNIMRSAFSLVPPYLRTDGKLEGVGGLPWFSEYGFQQTRGFRALKVWMALRNYGIEGYRVAIDKDIRLAEHLASLIRMDPSFELFEPQSLSIVCFRYSPPATRCDEKTLDSLNKTILERLQLEGKVFLTGTVINQQFWLRACIVNPRAQKDDMTLLLEAVKHSALQVGPTGNL
jgi:aromatic-L-amino-acid/L-tryptophan decarboxylase